MLLPNYVNAELNSILIPVSLTNNVLLWHESRYHFQQTMVYALSSHLRDEASAGIYQ
jgi:hypothetical protein